jgi:RND family efflux transporter MFP subunit
MMRSKVCCFVLATSAALGLTACGKDKAETAAAPPPSLAVTLAPAQSATLQRAVLASGPVSAWEEMQLGVELSGLRVTALHVDVGQAVRKGELLLELDHRTLDSELRQAKAAHDEASAGVQLAQVNLKRGQGLASSQLISASALDELRAALVQAQAREATTRAQRDGVALKRSFAELRAPDDGIIAKRLVQPGQVVAAGSQLLTLIRRGRLEWRADLPEAELARVQVGAQAHVQGPRGEVAGTVRAVSPGVDAATRTGTAYVDLPEPGALTVGAFVRGRILSDASPGLTVPAASVVMRDGYAYVFTVDAQGIAHRQRVTTGATLGERIEIISGLAAGAQVVERGAGFLGEGDRVKVVAAPTPPPLNKTSGTP